MFLLEFIDPLLFIISFCIGIFIVYITNPRPNIIIQYPKYDSLNETTYKKNNHTCFRYKSIDTTCSLNK